MTTISLYVYRPSVMPRIGRMDLTPHPFTDGEYQDAEGNVYGSEYVDKDPDALFSRFHLRQGHTLSQGDRVPTWARYNPDAKHYQIVWPVGVPPVSTENWDEASWMKHCMSFRPAGYYGGEFDTAAYEAWSDEKQAARFSRSFPGLDIKPLGNDQFSCTLKSIDKPASP